MADTTQNEGQAFHQLPTRREKFWRWCGFHYHLGQEPENVDTMIGWQKTDIHIDFGWIDRLRLLFTGRLFVALVQHSDAPSPMICKNRLDWRIIAPGESD